MHGTSYGGYATNLLITQTNRFKAAINISGKVDIISFYTDSPRLGVRNVFAGSPDRYPKLSREDVAAVDAGLVVFPDEPYAFTPDDGPEAWPRARPAFVSGRHLTWYGPSLAEAPAVLSAQLGAAAS